MARRYLKNVILRKDDQYDYTRDDRFQKEIASVGTNLLFLKTCNHFKHLTLAKEPLPFMNNHFFILEACMLEKVSYLTVVINIVAVLSQRRPLSQCTFLESFNKETQGS